ncbi:recombinase family protein [Shewanella sp. MBTL60-007]|uniref:recombinase family protein n=1 Tax=Shewanella sp. MBTL60-007 TaxID=2815911 RepID=UPI001BC44C33|nr:recombinase family protein [Shewanella sp. MBTL60-007]GIU31806.1 hypothetical protein TUM3792_43850 [Shewanella sp. MBTL60-007]
MTITAYVRISDANKQDSSTQRKVISDYAKECGLKIDNWKEFHISGSKTNAKTRGIEDLVSSVENDDAVLVSDVARLGRDNIHAVLNTITSITTRGGALHFCYSKTTIAPEDTNDLAKVFIAIGEAYAAVKFSEERSLKAKAAHARRKSEGLSSGRKVGAEVKHKLDDHAVAIMGMIDSGIKKTTMIAELEKMGVVVGRATLYRWIDKRLAGRGINK